jgi:hypothetical protein
MAVDPLLFSVLDRLEQLESVLLTWGYVDGGFTEEEIISISEDLGADNGEDTLDDLIAAELVVRLRMGRRVVYRTRSGETIRLLARLRQLFPKHASNEGWRNAPSLVSDFRYTLRRRSYPERSITTEDAMHRLAVGRSSQIVSALAEILATRGPAFRASRFQLDAATQILDDLQGSTSRATIVGAGTGSGKTLSFYLPALAHVYGQRDQGTHTKVIAVYPRNELLKDQFSETFAEARRLDALMDRDGSRKITIGAFFGPTPLSAQALARSASPSERVIWPRSGAGFICPYLRCPRCAGELVWVDDDVRAAVERLGCSSAGCGVVVGDDEVILTRSRMQDQQPDILFTTTEMLNRQLSDGWSSHVFGVGARARKKPTLMLLDEVHTYEGTTGAQAAYVIRRWRHAVGQPVQFVGLSATLRDAQSFFASLTGVPDHAVTSITPSNDDLVSEGMEHLIALRGDPVSGTSLLSTSIQTAMLLRRTLDVTSAPESTYGSRLFCFTDDLDVTNRLYFDLLDAEGRDSWGKIDPRGRGPLAALRASVGPDHVDRLLDGQSWDLCEAVGHHLDAAGSLKIGRTSSQDPGVMATSDVVVATASLDVGFNDPAVGAVLQHKAPRGAAQFLQRKGRAGRTRSMRPWTAVVLSDYGRDRLAYQGYELLFDPELDRRSLPLGNTYVVRIQAAFAFIDWLATKLPSNLRGSVWSDLAGPPEVHQQRSTNARARQAIELEWIDRVLADPLTRADLLRHVGRALRIDDEQVDLIAWEPPRSLLLHVLPTLSRRLATGWSRDGIRGADYQVQRQPLPEFVPANLFSDLSLPETEITLPAATRDSVETREQSPVLQALRTFAPGRVSRRYGVEHRYVRHWVPIPLDADTYTMDLGPFVTGVELGEYELLSPAGTPTTYVGLRPWTVRTERPPRHLLDASNSTLDWRSEFKPLDAGDASDIPSPSVWDDIIVNVHVFSHGRRSGVTVSRLAVGARATAVFDTGGEQAVEVSFQHDGRPTALGFELDVDAVRFEVRTPDFFAETHAYAADDAAMQSFRTYYFRASVHEDVALLAKANVFQLQWLSQLVLSVIVERALDQGSRPEEIVAGLTHADLSHEMKRVLEVIFEAGATAGEEEVEPTHDQQHRPRLHARLVELADDPMVTDRLLALSEALWSPPDDGWRRIASERFAATLGTALLEGIDRLCSDVGADALILDIQCESDGSTRIWLSEPSIGGGGIIEEFARRYAADPRRYFRLVRAVLGPSDFEVVDVELARALDVIVGDSDGRQRVANLRAAEGIAATDHALAALLDELNNRGVVTSHPVVAALSARVVRPGSSPESDVLIRNLVDQWRSDESRLGVEIDARVFAYIASASSAASSAAFHLPGVSTNRQWRFHAIYGLLWPRGNAVRAAALQAYNPFAQLRATDRLLVLSCLDDPHPDLDIEGQGWRQAAAEALVTYGAVSLSAPLRGLRELRTAVIEMQGVPIDAGHLLLHPRVVGYERRGERAIAILELRESYQ